MDDANTRLARCTESIYRTVRRSNHPVPSKMIRATYTKLFIGSVIQVLENQGATVIIFLTIAICAYPISQSWFARKFFEFQTFGWLLLASFGFAAAHFFNGATFILAVGLGLLSSFGTYYGAALLKEVIAKILRKSFK